MISVKRLQNVYVVANDVPATAAFYEQLFGLPRKFCDGERWIQFDVQGSAFALGCAAEGVAGQSGAVPVFEVQEFTGIEALVQQAGGEVQGLRDMGSHGRVMTVRDPAGNSIQLFCRATEA